MNYSVIGISNNPHFILSDEVNTLLQKHKVFSGGKRHYKLVKQLLPINHRWIDITGDMSVLFQKYKEMNQPIVVFSSGDPLFYGFANTIKKNHPGAKVKVYSQFNSIQLLCQKSNIPYQGIVNTSVHGRSWEELDVALIYQSNLIGILTDHIKTPAAIAHRMLEYNFSNYNMIIGEALEGENETITSLSLQEASKKIVNALNCVLLIKKEYKQKYFGIADTEFAGLENRPNMITKMPIRLVSLSQLDLHNRKTLWDIGFCTGSVSIEAKIQFPQLNVVAFEKRKECSDIFDVNTCKQSAPGITKVMGDFLEADFSLIPSPNAVFIGGHGGDLETLMQLIDNYLLLAGRVVMNAVKEQSKQSFIEMAERLKYNLLEPIEITINKHNPITILTAEKN